MPYITRIADLKAKRPRANRRLDPPEEALREESSTPEGESVLSWMRREEPAVLWLIGVCGLGLWLLFVQAVLAIWRIVFAWIGWP